MLNMTVYLCKGSDASNGKMLFLLRAIGEDRFCQYYDFKLTFRCNPLQVIKCIHELHLWSHKFLLSLKRGRLLREKTSNCKSIVLALFILIWIASSAWCRNMRWDWLLNAYSRADGKPVLIYRRFALVCSDPFCKCCWTEALLWWMPFLARGLKWIWITNGPKNWWFVNPELFERFFDRHS